jgi:hypothetical protein
MWVILQPDGAKGSSDVKVVARGLMRQVFLDGERMAILRADDVLNEDGIQAFSSCGAPPLQLWSWRAWYTDGKSFAVLFRKGGDIAPIVRPTDPWF